MRSSLFDDRRQGVAGGDRFMLQNSRLLRVQVGPAVLALKGSMVGYRGTVEFQHESAPTTSTTSFVKRVLTSEDTPLMRVRGKGEVFFANSAQRVFLVELEDDSLNVNGTSLLAFEASLGWDLRRPKGASIRAGGLFSTELAGRGTVALTSAAEPVVLECSRVPTFVDVHAAVAWSSNLQPKVVSSMNVRSLLRGGNGEALQYAFHGPGFVVMQPSVGAAPARDQEGSPGV